MTRGGSTSAWRRARALAFRVHGDVCLMCGDKATEVDHILEVANGGTDDVENLQPLCTGCHKAKTSAFNSKRMKPINKPFFWTDATPSTPFLSYLSPRLTIEPPISQKKEKASNNG